MISNAQRAPRTGSRPAPELARYDMISAERAGDSALATPPATADTALGVLPAVLERHGQQRSAAQARNKALADSLLPPMGAFSIAVATTGGCVGA